MTPSTSDCWSHCSGSRELINCTSLLISVRFHHLTIPAEEGRVTSPSLLCSMSFDYNQMEEGCGSAVLFDERVLFKFLKYSLIFLMTEFSVYRAFVNDCNVNIYFWPLYIVLIIIISST